MSDGINYRLGYLSARLRAYEGEEALKKLVEQRIKKGTFKPKEPAPAQAYDPAKLNMVEAIKVYAENERLYIDSTLIESGTKRPDRKLTLKGALHPKLRPVIPQRDNDMSVPAFIRNFDFKMEHSTIHKKETSARSRKQP